MKRYSKKQIKALFKANRDGITYKKSGKFLYRLAKLNETILTVVSGKLETMKEAKSGDVVLINIEIGSSAERYIVDNETFHVRYSTKSTEYFLDGQTWFLALARGELHGFFYVGETIKFDAPWGEEMLLEDGDFLGRPVGDNEDDIYRVEKDAFNNTYKPKLIEE